MRIDVEVDDAALVKAMRATRRELNQDIKRSFSVVGGQVLLPVARRKTPSVSGVLRRSIIFRATTTGGYLTTSLTRRHGSRRLGLLEFGGTRKDVIVPKRAKALRMPDGRFVARVGGTDTTRRFGVFKKTTVRGRVYKAQGFLTKARDQQLPYVTQSLEIQLARAVQRHIDRNTFPA